jgi:dihydroorotate dehydrogenase electron transfer subunit
MYSVVELRESWEVAKNVRAFRLSRGFDFIPGQFVMLWLPGIGEKPFSLAWKDMLVVKRVGHFTSRLFELEEGERLWVRGPYGRGFEPKGERIALIAIWLC